MARRRESTLREEIADSGETPLDPQAAAERADREDLGFLAREFLTWLVFHADASAGEFEGEGEVAPFTIYFGGRLSLRTHAGLVNEMTLKGPLPADSPDLRYALAGGLSVKEADLRFEQGERTFTFTLAADHFDLKRVKLPELLTEEEDERADERLGLLDELDAALRVAFARFVGERTRPSWTRTVVPGLKQWLTDGT